jgi:uncharacterized damage-inducible protein DinB
MFAEALRRLYAYNGWATGRILDAAEDLTSDQFNAPGQAGHGSIRDTLVHMLNTHHGWLSWWDGSLSAEEAYSLTLDPSDFPDVASLRAFLTKAEQQTQAFVSRLEGDDPGRIYAWDLPDGRRWEMSLWEKISTPTFLTPPELLARPTLEAHPHAPSRRCPADTYPWPPVWA